MSVSLNGTNGLTFNDASTQNTSAFYGGLAMRNRIINGAMVIDQRNAGASITGNDNVFPLDRFQFLGSQSAKFSAQQNQGGVTPPTGFKNYLGLTVASAVSLISTDYFLLGQRIEGFNIADLAWGTASAAPVTLSFRVYSSLTGTFGGVLKNNSGTRVYPFTYSIPTANTWTTISVTIAGDTSGTWLTDNSVGIYVIWGLGVGATYSGTAGAWGGTNVNSATGAVSVVGTSGATFYITGVQLEKGSTATSFDYRPFGTELMLCQRYLPAFNSQSGASKVGPSSGESTTNNALHYTFIVTPRVAPTGITVSSAAHFSLHVSGANTSLNSLSFSDVSLIGATLGAATATAASIQNAAGYVYSNSSAGQILFTGCEL